MGAPCGRGWGSFISLSLYWAWSAVSIPQVLTDHALSGLQASLGGQLSADLGLGQAGRAGGFRRPLKDVFIRGPLSAGRGQHGRGGPQTQHRPEAQPPQHPATLPLIRPRRAGSSAEEPPGGWPGVGKQEGARHPPS